MRFLVDQQLPPALARWLAAAGHRAEHVQDLELGTATDHALCKLPLSTGAVIVTKDDDFVDLSRIQGGPPIVWIRFGNTRRAELLERLSPVLAEIVSALEAGEMLIEVRS